jgi:RND family efflux transporter MFP subunit
MAEPTDIAEPAGKAARVGLRRAFLRRGVPLALGGLVITGAGTGWAMIGDSGPEYRTAVASIGSVDQLANFTGAVATMGRASAAFGVAGTVDKVSVKPGDKVEKGDVLATLDKADLQAAVRAARATLAQAEATLESDSSSSAGSSASSGSSGSSSAGSSGAPASGGSASGSSGAPGGSGGPGGSDAPSGSANNFDVDLTSQIAAVNAARKDADEALTAANTAMSGQESACATVLSDGGSGAGSDERTPTPTPDATPEATPDATPEATPEATPSENSQALLDCVDALKAVQAAQAKVAAAQAAIDVADDAFTTAMNDAVKKLVADAEAAAKQAQAAADAAAKKATEEATAAAKAAAEKAAAQAAAQQTATSRQGGATGATSEAEKAARIAVDEAAISSAEAALASAQEDLQDAVLKAPVAGTIGDVPFTAGQAASASDAISLFGTDAVEVTINVPLTTAEELTKGMEASVTADGADQAADGTVNTIGVLPDTSSGTATYPVTILVPQPSSSLAEGAAAAVALTLKSATDAVTVPNSALIPTGNAGTSFVTLIQDGKPVRKTVTTGAVGETRTAVTEGLAAGDTVVLADAASAVPASSTTSNSRTGFGGQIPGGGGNFAIPAGGNFAGTGGTRR